MPRDTVIKATIDIDARINDFQAQMNKVKTELSKFSLTDGMKDDFKSLFTNLESEIKNIQNKTANKELNIVDEKSVAKSFERIGSLWQQLNNRISSSKVQGKLLDSDQKALDKLTRLTKQYNKELGSTETQLGKAARAVRTQADEVEKLERNLKKQTELQQLYTDRVSNNRAVEQIQQEIKETKELIKEKEQLVESIEKEARARVPSEEEFKAGYSNKSGTKSGWKSAYQKKKKDIETQILQETTQAQNELNEARRRGNELQTELNNTKADQKGLNDASKNIETLNKRVETAKENLKGLNQNLNAAKSDAFEKVKKSLEEITDISWEKFGIDPKSITSFELLEKAIDKIRIQGGQGATEAIGRINEILVSSKKASDDATRGFDQASSSLHEMSESARQLDQMRNNILQFFSIGNAVNLFKRAIHSAVETVKDLDKVMTETAVVTEFSVGDMWTQLPEYTKRANELGVSIHDVYEASTLYYQQGLQTNEVMAVTNATLRMARIASLDAAEATDRITNALRGFNMEINESNADNIADVYSKLAAISASDVDEISTAMTKVASLASSANMQFENTAAFLAQIIETTRESAETAGTALKTVVARFSEVKDLYSKGELLGTDEEGEEIDVNKVSKALRVAGINLNEFLTGQKGLDEIFMDLASKWDDLDIVQQRYIATMAAGSRQQSRFIALMSDYERTQELTTAAQDANGAAMEQYNKTLESLETKITKLKNAWNEFLMSIANSDVIKGVVDALTGLVQGINKVVNAVSGGNGLLKSIAAIGISVGGLKLGRSLFNSIFGDPKSAGKGWMGQVLSIIKGERPAISKTGAEIGESLVDGIKDKFSNLRGLLAKTFSSKLTAGQLGLKSIDLGDIDFKLNEGQETPALLNALNNIDLTKLNRDQLTLLDGLIDKYESGSLTVQEFNQRMQQSGIQMSLTKDQADELGIGFKNNSQILNTFRTALIGTGIAFTALGGIIEKVTGESSGFTKVLKNVGMGLTALGSLLPVIDGAFKAFGVSVSTTIMNIPIIGWIAAIITAVITLVTILSEVIETPAEAAKDAKEALDQATQAANSAKEAVDNLASSYSEIVNNADKLDDLTQGTEEWRKAVEENNKAVLDLLQNYKELNIESQDGVLIITNYDSVMSDYAKREKNQQIGSVAANINSTQKQFDAEFADLKQRIIEGIVVPMSSVGYKSSDFGDDDLMKLIQMAARGERENIDEWLKDTYGYENKGTKKISDNEFQELKNLGEAFNSIEAQTDSLYDSASVMALNYAKLNESQEKYVDSLVNGAFNIDKVVEQLNSEIPKKYENIGINQQQAYLKYVQETYGKDVIIGPNGNFKATIGDEEKAFKWETELPKFIMWQASTQKYAQALENQTAYLVELSKLEDENSKSLARVYEGNKGNQLNLSDLDNLEEELGIDFDNLTIEELIGDERLKNYFESNKKLKEAFGDDFDSWAQTFATNIIVARDTINKAYGDFNNEQFKEATKHFSAETIGAITGALEEYTPSDNGAFGTAIITALEKLLPDDSELESVLDAFSTVQWNSVEDLESFKETLSSMGIDVAESEFDEFLNTVQSGVEALTHIDFNTFNDQVKDLAKIIGEIRSGKKDRLFSEEEYNLLTQNGVDKNKFVQGLSGEYSYLGNDLEEIINAANAGVIEKARNELKYNQVRFDAASEISRADYWNNENITKRAQLTLATAQARREGTLGSWGIAGLDSNTKFGQLDDEDVDKLWEAIDTFKNSTELYSENVEKYSQSIPILEAMTLGAQGIVDAWEHGTIDAQTGADALNNLMVSSNLPDQLKQQYIEIFNDPTLTEAAAQSMAASMANMMDVYSDAEYWGVDTDLLLNMGENYAATMNLASDTAAKLALENVNLNTGLQNIVSSYEKWNGVLQQGIDDETIRKTSEYQETIAELEKNIKQMFSLKGNLSADFMNSKETTELLQAISTGDLDSIDTLGRMASQDIKKQFKFGSGKAAQRNANMRGANQASGGIVPFELEPEVTEESFALAENQLFDFIDSLDPNIDIHTQVNPEDLNNATAGIIDQMNTMLEAGEITADQMQDYFSSIGFVPDVTYEYKKISQRFTGSLPYVDEDSRGKPKISHLEYDYTADVMTAVPQVTDIHYQGPRGKITNPGVRNTMANNAQPKTSTPKSSDSQKEEKPKVWLNPYDELYNLQQKINTALRERERLEHRYEDMLKDHTKLTDDLVENTLRETASLKQQLALQKQMLAGRQQQVRKVANDKYEDSEGNITTLGAMGVTRYASYDLNTNTIQIDYDAIDKITDENIGKAVEQYISRLEELQGEIVDTEDTIEDINDQLIEIRDRGKEEYLDFEQKVYDALVARKEEEIEALESISSSISDAANKTINAIQEQISKERQARENEKTEQDIADKEMRLAYLQRDTSGANDLEIMKLQKEISDDQLSYQDQIIDQTIQEMQDEATRAEQQRQAQIDLLKDLLEHEKTYGMFWVDVEEKLKGAFDADGKIKVESDLYKLLQEDASWQGLSKFQSLQWTEDISKEIAIAIQGLQNYTLTEGKTKTGKLVLTDGTTLTYDSKNGTWYDSKGKKSYSDNDLYWDYGKQAYSLKPTNKAQTTASKTTRVENAAKVTTPSTSTTTTQKTSAPPQTPKNSEPAKLGRITNTYGWVNVRSSVAYGNNVIGHTNRGESFDVIGYGDYGWYKIKLPNGQIGYTAVHQNGTPLYSFTPYKTGGLADFTGPAWLDGTKSRPEMVLDAADTQNFIALKDILASILKNTSSTKANTSSGDNYFDIDIQAEIDSDYDVDQLAERIKKQIYDAAEYRNVNAISLMR